MWTLLLACACACARLATATPLDLMPGEDQPRAFELSDCYAEAELDSKVALRSERSKWPNATVVYEISERFTSEQKEVIVAGMKLISDKTCITFREKAANEQAFVDVDNQRSGCFSSIGRTGRKQLLNLARGCVNRGTVAHEFIHALGFFHEQARPDRDDFVTINTENIQDGMQSQFNKQNANRVDTFDVGYDYASIMHYGRRAFSKNGKDTITPKQEVRRLGGNSVTDLDAEKLNKSYKCPAEDK